MTATKPAGARDPATAGFPMVRRTAAATVVALIVLVGTGGWVRLSDSGLGCATWPKCFANDLMARASYHSLVEFTNRCVIITVGVLVVAALVMAVRYRPRRLDLMRLSAGLVLGYLAEAVLGGLTVLRGLAPAVVAAHMIVALILVAAAVILHHRARPLPLRPAQSGSPAVWWGRLVLAIFGALAVVGTAVTGSGPHAGSPDAPRLPLPRTAVTELHAVVGMFLLGLLVAGYLILRVGQVSDRARRGYRAVMVLMLAQAGLGYLQYFTGLPADLVELHVLGAAVLLAALVRAYLELPLA